MKNANAAITLPEKCVCGAVLFQLSYQSHMRAVVCGFGPLCSVHVQCSAQVYQFHGLGNRCPTYFFISVHLIYFTAEYILSSCLFVGSYGFYAILNT